MSVSNKRVMIIAAEASSAHYALKLISYWQGRNQNQAQNQSESQTQGQSENKSVNQKRNYEFFGVGSKQMEDLGFRRLGKSEEMAVVGIAEIFDNLSLIRSVFHRLLEECQKNPPDIVVLMDYPDFNLRLAKKLKALGIKVFYYISPQVWAWRQNRIHDIKAYCEKVFLLFPFEKEFYDRFAVPNEFVGHPLLEDLDPELLDQKKIAVHKNQYGVTDSEKILALMPGSRRGEIEKNFPTQLQVAKKLLDEFSHLRLFIFVAPPLSKEYLQSWLEGFPENYVLIKEDPNQMISLADYILVTSGTATLMVGLLEKPMVIMYKVKWMTGVIGNWLVRHLQFFGLVNLVLGFEAVPERKQKQATVEELTALMRKYIVSQDYTQKTIENLRQLKNRLGEVGATERVAEALERYLK